MSKITYTFHNKKLLNQALTHRSYAEPHNERLEFLGDALLNCVITQALYEKFPRSTEGELTRFRAALVKGDTLAEVAQSLEIGDELLLGIGELKTGGFQRPSILAGALEAVLGAVYLDGGFEACQMLILEWFQERLKTIDTVAREKDPKTALQEYLQSKKLPLPQYHLKDTDIQAEQTFFTIECRVEGVAFTTESKGLSRRKLEQATAEAFLLKLRQG